MAAVYELAQLEPGQWYWRKPGTEWIGPYTRMNWAELGAVNDMRPAEHPHDNVRVKKNQ